MFFLHFQSPGRFNKSLIQPLRTWTSSISGVSLQNCIEKCFPCDNMSRVTFPFFRNDTGMKKKNILDQSLFTSLDGHCITPVCARVCDSSSCFLMSAFSLSLYVYVFRLSLIKTPILLVKCRHSTGSLKRVIQPAYVYTFFPRLGFSHTLTLKRGYRGRTFKI